MKKYFVFSFLGGIIFLSPMGANAEDCPSGHFYRMSGRCADAAGHKVYAAPAGAVHRPVKPNKKPQNLRQLAPGIGAPALCSRLP